MKEVTMEKVPPKQQDARAAPDVAHEPRQSFRAEIVKGRLVKATSRSLKIESGGQVRDFRHGIEYTDLLGLVERCGGKPVIVYVVNKFIKKLTPS